MNARTQAAVAAMAGISDQVDFTFTDTLDVESEYIHPEARTSSHPGDCGGLFPVAVFWRGIEITRLLDPSELDAIAEKINARG